MKELNLPESMIQNVTGAHGERGVQWLRDMPSLIETLSRTWNLSRIDPYRNLSYNFVAAAARDGDTDVVLKVGIPTRELLTEISALQLYEGRGAVRLIASDPEIGALLLEKVKPGSPLTDLTDDEQATCIAASMMRKIQRPLPIDHQLPTLRDWGRSLLNASPNNSPLPKSLLEHAQRVFLDLIESAPETVLLHGDLHHDNILEAEREPWLVIDPKGLAGDPAYEVGPFLLNPARVVVALDYPEIVNRRVDLLSAELEIDRSRILAWGFAQAMLSACWFVEEGSEGWRKNVACAEVMVSL